MTIQENKTNLVIDSAGKLIFSLGEERWESRGPFLILHYYDRQHPRAQMVSAPSNVSYAFGTAGTPSLSATGELLTRAEPNGNFLITAQFSNIGIQLSLTVTPAKNGQGFSVRIEDDGTTENIPGLYRILGVELLPEFGAARTGETGYLTLPNWSGCQTYFDKSYPREVWQTVYSSNDQWEYVCNMPVWGITRSKGTLCGLVVQGDFDLQLVCRVHWEEDHLNSVHPYLVYRWEQQDDRIAGCREVRYAFAPATYKNGEGYVFCAKQYRNFLRQERGLLSWDEKSRTRPAVLGYRDRFLMKIFMAYKDPQADGHGPYHSTCSFAEVRQILEQCLSRGMRHLAALLVGWGQDGHDGMLPRRFPVDERLGGEKALRDLILWCRGNDILIGVHDSYGESYSCSPEFDENDLIQHRSGERWRGVIWSGGQVHKICPAVYVNKHTRRDVPAIRALGIYGHHHIDAVGSFMTCFAKEHPVQTRAGFVAEVRRMFEFVSEEMGSVSTEMPFGQYFDVVDGFWTTYTNPHAWHRASPMGRYFLDRTIPLVQIVVHGSANCHEGVEKMRVQPMQGVAWGLSPQQEVCMRPSPSFGIPAYSEVADGMAEFYNRYYGEEGLALKLNGHWIEGFWEEADGVTRILYSNGTLVRVNATAVDHGDLPSHSYKIEN